MIKAFYSSIFLGLSTLVFAQKIDTQKLDQYFNTLFANKKVMGSFAISNSNEIIYTKTVGYANVQPEIVANNDTQYRIGSVSKIFTSVLVMKAVEDKKLKLDAKLSDFFPQFDNANKITIEQLLQHRSGIKNLTEDIGFFAYFDRPNSQEELIESIKSLGTDFEPGTQYSYSNSNYIILAFIVEKAFKKSYAQLIDEKIAKPLGLKRTKVMDKIDPNKGMANSFTFMMGKYSQAKQTDTSVAIGGGNLMSTSSDLLTFILGLENGKLVSKESLKKMQNYKDNYGYALTTVPFCQSLGFGHNGSIDEFRSALYYFPDLKIGMSYIVNQSNMNNNDISLTLMRAATGKDFTIPNFEIIKVNEEDLKPLVGTYSTNELPLKINIFIKDARLMGQATGQGAFPLDAISTTKFVFNQAGIEMEFNPEKKEMKFSQQSNEFLFKKE